MRDKELDLADALMDTLGEVDLEDLHDEYREAVEEVVAAKAAGETPREAPAPEAGGGKVLDLMAALENSVRAARESRGEEPAEDAEVKHLQRSKTSRSSPKDTGGKKSTSTAKKKTTSSPRKSTSKTSQAEKKSTTTKKTAAKKTPAKKTTSRKRSA